MKCLLMAKPIHRARRQSSMHTAIHTYIQGVHIDDFYLKEEKTGMDLTRLQNEKANLSGQQIHYSSSNWYYIFFL